MENRSHEMRDAERVAVTCRCVRCGTCNGSGSIWFDYRGKYLGNQRSDDLDELEICDDCGGSGISEECDECLDSRYDDEPP